MATCMFNLSLAKLTFYAWLILLWSWREGATDEWCWNWAANGYILLTDNYWTNFAWMFYVGGLFKQYRSFWEMYSEYNKTYAKACKWVSPSHFKDAIWKVACTLRALCSAQIAEGQACNGRILQQVPGDEAGGCYAHSGVPHAAASKYDDICNDDIITRLRFCDTQMFKLDLGRLIQWVRLM